MKTKYCQDLWFSSLFPRPHKGHPGNSLKVPPIYTLRTRVGCVSIVSCNKCLESWMHSQGSLERAGKFWKGLTITLMVPCSTRRGEAAEVKSPEWGFRRPEPLRSRGDLGKIIWLLEDSCKWRCCTRTFHLWWIITWRLCVASRVGGHDSDAWSAEGGLPLWNFIVELVICLPPPSLPHSLTLSPVQELCAVRSLPPLLGIIRALQHQQIGWGQSQ